MLLNAREVPDGSTLEADVCVVGGGPAGLVLTRELARAGVRVCLLESGGVEHDPAAQALGVGDTTGDPFKELPTTRARQLGGTANLWDTRLADGKEGFRGAPLDPVDFERREWVPNSGWPFDRAHLDPFYARAHEACGFGPYEYRADAWARPDGPPLPLRGDLLTTGILQFGSQRLFTTRYREEIARDPSVAAYVDATAVEIETNETASVATHVRVGRLGGGGFRVAARHVVLACGGLENARLLLASDRVQRGGLGNGHDVVGRYFMEHQYIRTGKLIPRDRAIFDRTALYDERRVDGAVVMGNLHLTPAAMRRERLLHCSLALIPQHGAHDRFRQEAVDSLALLLKSALRGRLPEDAGAHAREVLGHADFIAVAALRKASGKRLFRYRVEPPTLIDAGWSALDDKPRRFGRFDLILHAEQAPDPDNRVTLGETRDALGCRTARLHWRWRDRDVDSVLRAQSLMAEEFERSGIGTIRLDLPDGRPNLLLPGLHHHMGTTRMDPDPKRGVVDADGRVHGTANLFVTGCSIFPTGGYINPTLTIVALSIRLADHLAGVLGAGARQAAADERPQPHRQETSRR